MERDSFTFVGEIKEKKDLLFEAIDILDELNIPISRKVEFKYNNAISYYGICKKLEHHSSDYRVLIRKDLPDDNFIGTAIHELLHTICIKDGHQGKWKYYANIVNQNTRYYIARANGFTVDDVELKNMPSFEKHQYYLKCKNELSVDNLLKRYSAFCAWLPDEDLTDYLCYLIDKCDWDDYQVAKTLKKFKPKGFKTELYHRCISGYYNKRIKTYKDYVFISDFFCATSLYSKITDYYKQNTTGFKIV